MKFIRQPVVQEFFFQLYGRNYYYIVRMGTKLKGYKSCYKTTEISVMEETRVSVKVTQAQ